MEGANECVNCNPGFYIDGNGNFLLKSNATADVDYIQGINGDLIYFGLFIVLM